MHRKAKFNKKLFDRTDLTAFKKRFDMAAVFSYVDYVNMPLAYLYQLQKIGIFNIYIILNEDEFKKAQSNKFILFDHSEPKTIIEHYQSQSSDLTIRVINSGKASTEEEKLAFYLENAKETHLLNLFLTNEALPWVNKSFHSDVPHIEVTTFLNFFEQENRIINIPFQLEMPSAQELELLQHPSNPIICFQRDTFDIGNYQWLFKIFSGLINLRMQTESNIDFSETKAKLDMLITSYKENIDELKKCEELFEVTHKKLYVENDNSVQKTHQRNVENRDKCLKKFPQIINELIDTYKAMPKANKLKPEL